MKTVNDTFVVSQVVTTRRICVPALARQEQFFLADLNDAARHEVEENTWLVVYDSSDKPRLKLIEEKPQPESRNTKIDQSIK